MTTGIIYSARVEKPQKVKYAYPLGNVVREVFVDVNVFKEFFSEGRYTKTISIYLGNYNLSQFNALDPHYIDNRIQSIVGDDDYVFIGYWAGKAWIPK